MATFKKSNVSVHLSKAEQAEVDRAMRHLMKVRSASRASDLDQRSRHHHKLKNSIRRELKIAGRVGGLQASPAEKQYLASRNDILRSMHPRLWRRTGKKPKHRNAVWGQTWGIDTPTYDFNWEYHDITGSIAAGDFVTSADVTTGQLHALALAPGHGSINYADCYAGVGFWYIPDRSGIFNVGIVPALNQAIAAGAWYDEGEANTRISLGIASFNRDPFFFVEWETIQADKLAALDIGWMDVQQFTEDWSAYSMQVSCPVDSEHYYACWAWIEAYAYRDDDGFGAAEVKATVDSFSFWLV